MWAGRNMAQNTPNKTRRLGGGLLALSMMAVLGCGYQLYKLDAANQSDLGLATDMVTLSLMTEDDFRLMADPLDDMRPYAQAVLKARYPDYELVQVNWDEDRTVSVTLRAQMPLVSNGVWTRRYEASARGPMPLPHCRDIEGLDLDIA